MKIMSFLTRFAVIVAIGSFASEAGAQLTTFGQWNQTAPGNQFNIVNNGQPVGGGGQVDFTANNTNPPNIGVRGVFTFLLADFQSTPLEAQTAYFAINLTSTTAANVGGTFDQIFSGTIQIVRATPYFGLTNLLTITLSNFVLSGASGSGSASGSASSAVAGTTVTMTSDFVDFTNTTQRDVGAGLSSVTPAYALDINGMIRSFTAASTWTFSTDPPPDVTFVPEVNTGIVFMAIVGLAVGGELIRKRRKKLVPVPVKA